MNSGEDTVEFPKVTPSHSRRALMPLRALFSIVTFLSYHRAAPSGTHILVEVVLSRMTREHFAPNYGHCHGVKYTP